MIGLRTPTSRRRWPCAVASLLMLAAAGSGAASGADDAPPEKGPPLAFVGDTPIDGAAIGLVIRRLHPVSKPSGEQRRQIEVSVLEQLVDEALLRAELANQLVEVADGEIQAGVERLRGQLASRGVTLEAFMAESGRDEQGLREQIRLELAIDKYIRPRMTADQVNAFFEQNRREFDGTRLRVSHIVLRPDIVDTEGVDRQVRQAEVIRRDILQGKIAFDEAARRFSAGPSRHKGGDVGWITRSGPMVEAFNKPVFTLAKGNVSKPIMTPFGVHLVKVIDVEPGRIGLDAVRPGLEKMMAAQLIRDLLAKARAATPVTYTPGVAHFDPATPADGPDPRRIIVEGGE